jgi:hypothetical protein
MVSENNIKFEYNQIRVYISSEKKKKKKKKNPSLTHNLFLSFYLFISLLQL